MVRPCQPCNLSTLRAGPARRTKAAPSSSHVADGACLQTYKRFVLENRYYYAHDYHY
jgi:hypothetical protein